MQISAVSHCWDSSWCNRAGPCTGKPPSSRVRRCWPVLGTETSCAVPQLLSGWRSWAQKLHVRSLERVSPLSFQEEIVSSDPMLHFCILWWKIVSSRGHMHKKHPYIKTWATVSSSHQTLLTYQTKSPNTCSFKINIKRSHKTIQFERPYWPSRQERVEGGLPGNFHSSQLESHLIGLMYSHYSGEMPFGSKVCLHRAGLFPERVQTHCVQMAHPKN